MNSNEQSSLQPRQQESSVVQARKSGYTLPTSIEDAVGRKQDAISAIRKDKQKLALLVKWVESRLIKVFTYLGAFGNVTEFQVKMLAQRICAKYYYFTPAELDFFFVSFMNGEYGKLYNNGTINPQDIMQALIRYEPDLLAARSIKADEEYKRKQALRALEDAKKPHGVMGWIEYCRNNGLDPNTHRPATLSLAKDMNKELNPERNENGIIKQKQEAPQSHPNP